MKETEELLISKAREAVSQCNWVVGECAANWTQRYARGRTDAEFGQMVGLSGDQIFQRRRVWEAFGNAHEKFPALKVWPFDMPLAKLDQEALSDTRVVVAEVLTTLNATNQQSSEIRDEAQVRSICEALAERDANGKLAAMFAGEAKLTDAQKAAVTAEEGWILGI